ncbi:Alcohol dehydrogenase [acceptor] [Providencia alcalifaciens]|nr:Alcohol dehydrogenase [acceptor] [Providencia alcalifaciens]
MSTQKYDYIIVGAGSAGCVLAARLIQETQARVLLIEAGGSDNHMFIRMPAGVAKIIAQKSWPMKPNQNLMPTTAKCKLLRVACWEAVVPSTV